MRHIIFSLVILLVSIISLSSQTSVFTRIILVNNSGKSAILIAGGISYKSGKSSFEIRGFRNLNLQVDGVTASYSRNLFVKKLGNGFTFAVNGITEATYIPKPNLGIGMMGGNVALVYRPTKKITVVLPFVTGVTHSKKGTGYTFRGILNIFYRL